MRKPRFRQSMEVFENMLREKELILYRKSKETAVVCKTYKVKYIVDQNDELCDITVGNVKIYSPDKLYCENPENVIILVCAADRHAYEITNAIYEIEDFTVFYWNVLKNTYLNEISNGLYDNYEKIHTIEKMLCDDYSRKVLREVVIRRIIGMKSGYDDLKVRDEIQYLFPPALFSKTRGAILDCGGYIGDTIDRFVNKLGHTLDRIYSFEVLPENIAALEKKKNEVSKIWSGEITIVPFALADKRRIISFNETEKRGGCFSADFRNTTRYRYKNPIRIFEAEAVRIDDVVGDDESVRYIKMDIEGAEYEALIGAEKTIRRERPGLAISIYHNVNDYYRLAELILSYIPEYKLAVRHHKDKHVDTVLYAWI